MKPSDSIWQDGKLVPWDSATVHVTAHSLHYGNAVFEGIRAYATPKGPAILQLQRHVRRMFQSCSVLDMEIPFSPEEIEAREPRAGLDAEQWDPGHPQGPQGGS